MDADTHTRGYQIEGSQQAVPETMPEIRRDSAEIVMPDDIEMIGIRIREYETR